MIVKAGEHDPEGSWCGQQEGILRRRCDGVTVVSRNAHQEGFSQEHARATQCCCARAWWRRDSLALATRWFMHLVVLIIGVGVWSKIIMSQGMSGRTWVNFKNKQLWGQRYGVVCQASTCYTSISYGCRFGSWLIHYWSTSLLMTQEGSGGWLKPLRPCTHVVRGACVSSSW